MHKLPTLSSKELIKFLGELGYSIDRQRGSHIRLKKKLPTGHHSITVPAHKEIAKGTLNDILNKISTCNQIPKEKLITMLKKS